MPFKYFCPVSVRLAKRSAAGMAASTISPPTTPESTVSFISALALFELGTMQESPALELPMHWVYSVIPLSGLLLLYYALRDIWACLTQKDKALDGVKEEDSPC